MTHLDSTLPMVVFEVWDISVGVRLNEAKLQVETLCVQNLGFIHFPLTH